MGSGSSVLGWVGKVNERVEWAMVFGGADSREMVGERGRWGDGERGKQSGSTVPLCWRVMLFNKVEVEFHFVWARTVYCGGNEVFAWIRGAEREEKVVKMRAKMRFGAGFGCDLERRGAWVTGDWIAEKQTGSTVPVCFAPDLFNKPEVEFRFVWARTEYSGGKRVLVCVGVWNEGDFLGEFEGKNGLKDES
jgi:hypothetical protein